MSDSSLANPLHPPLPQNEGERLHWGRLYGHAAALAIASAIREFDGLVVVLADDVQGASELEQALRFFMDDDASVLSFPDWETLPYDVFSPLPELVSQRLKTLYRLPQTKRGALVAPVATLLQRLPPRAYLDAHAFVMQVGDRMDLDEMRRRLEQAGYSYVSQVMSHGEFAVRGSLLDLFPMGSGEPFRIDLFDDEIETIRTFNPETQRTIEKVEQVELLPAREFPLDEAGIAHFRQAWRTAFEGDPQAATIYREVSNGNAPGGLEYYLSLFFEETTDLFDYLPENRLLIRFEQTRELAQTFFDQVAERHDQRRHDRERPILPPEAIYLEPDDFGARLKEGRSILVQKAEIESRRKGYAAFHNFASKLPPPLGIQARAERPAAALQEFLAKQTGKVLFVAESAGRREMLRETLGGFGIVPKVVEGWRGFVEGKEPLGLTAAQFEQGLWLDDLVVITESQILGERVRQERRRKARSRDADQVVRNLTELLEGAPVVHEDHGVGRYLGLQAINVGGMETEFLTLEYARGDKLYVPVSSLHLISRYSGSSPENAPLHKLGGDQWERIKKRAAEKVHDVAAELLEIHARRAANKGYAFAEPDHGYREFADAFEFEETPDQQQAIEAVLADMQSPQPMDRVVCGDVGFGKTEVAMRAAFLAAHGGKQVAVLVPTTLLAQQHYQNFADRFADSAVRVESLSRFGTAREQKKVFDGLRNGSIDIVVGTHKLLSKEVQFKNLGLAIIDEEHRFGVRHKEKLKALRAEVDLLTLTATPIPRTLNMAMAGMRDLSIIATPPVARHPIKTFVHEWNDTIVVEACQREIKRGGQVYFLHNEVKSIDGMARKLGELLPDARVQVAHGQLRERQLEEIMRDFYHQRFNILVCTTIVESGIDVPSANTILINRADKLGMAQLHQLRGRVGRSHHRAYAYLIVPPVKALTADAKKRLEAIESMEDLGAGFTLATHDLEIRGAGELLGDEQSGQINEIGFTLYSELLERAVNALKSGHTPRLDRPLDHGAEVDLQLPALIPGDYLPDVHSRLVFYKRIAGAETQEDLKELQVEMIDRFGLMPDPLKALFDVTALKLKANPIGIRKIEAGPQAGRILFDGEPKVDPMNIINLIQKRPKEFKLDGGDKLRFFLDMEERESRVEKVAEVLELISG
jgi:transcription-repair coupling factor (superfamily II helicase)